MAEFRPGGSRASTGFGPWAFLAGTQEGVPLTEPLQDQTPLGSFWVRTGVSVMTTATHVPISLPRSPSLFFWNTDRGVTVYQTASDKAASTASDFVCRADLSTIATLVIG